MRTFRKQSVLRPQTGKFVLQKRSMRKSYIGKNVSERGWVSNETICEGLYNPQALNACYTISKSLYRINCRFMHRLKHNATRLQTLKFMLQFQSERVLLSYEQLPCCQEVSGCEGIEIDSTCNRLSVSVSTIPIGCAAPTLIDTCGLVS